MRITTRGRSCGSQRRARFIMPKRHGSAQSALAELERVTRLLTDEVIPRLPHPPAADDGSEPPSHPPDDERPRPVPDGASDALEAMYRRLTPESTAKLTA